MTAASTAGEKATVELLRKGSELCRAAGRPDLSPSLDESAARMLRPASLVCVVGEYKQGKSQVINSLIGREVCTVDDDLATAAITVIGHGPEAAAVVHRTDNGERSTEEIALSDLPRFTAEASDGSFPDGVDLVEVAIPSRVLERGIAVVDTPGVNSFRPGNEKAVLDFLSHADGLVVVSDASAELSPPELDFAAAAKEVCPHVLVALTKVDLYPEWRRIAEIDTGHLQAIGLGDALVPISSTLRAQALALGDRELNAESGYPSFLSSIAHGVLTPARRQASTRALSDLLSTMTALRAIHQNALDSLEDPANVEARLAELRRAEEGVARLRLASSRWSVALNDGMADLRSSVDYQLRTMMRRHLQETDTALADGKVRAEWATLVEELKSSLADDAIGLFAAVRDGSDRVAGTVAEMIADDLPKSDGGSTGLDIHSLWDSTDRELRVSGPSVLTSGLSVLRGGYSGMLMLGMLAQVAGIATLGPLSVGVGALFGAKQFREERKKQQERQRQEARTVVRQFLDQVQLELSTGTQRAVQDSHRSLRDHFAERISDLSVSYARATQVLEQSAAADEDRRQQLIREVGGRLEEIDQLITAAARATSP